MAPRSKKAERIDEVKRLYIDEQHSLGEISRSMGISIQTLSKWLKEEGVVLAARPRRTALTPERQAEVNRQISESQRARLEAGGARGGRSRRAPREMRSCANEGCAAYFEVPSTSEQRYCSRTCARIVGNTERWADKRRETTCPCGVIFYSPYAKKYCSPECRMTYGIKRQPDPSKHVTFACLNCGIEVTRLRKSGYNKYCSNACAVRHTKTKHHVVLKDSDVLLDSSWEALVWGLLSYLKIPVYRTDRITAVEWAPGQHYAPDLYLPGPGISLEIKGQQDADDPAKWAAWREACGPLVVLDEQSIDALRRAEDPIALLSSWS